MKRMLSKKRLTERGKAKALRAYRKWQYKQAALELMRVTGVSHLADLEALAGIKSGATAVFRRNEKVWKALGEKYKVNLPNKEENVGSVVQVHPVVDALPQAKIERFYKSYQWRKLRYEILLRFGRKCMCCSTTEGNMHVDHIKPLRKNWNLRLDPENMQVLCAVCNHGKGNWDETDHRPDPASMVIWDE